MQPLIPLEPVVSGTDGSGVMLAYGLDPSGRPVHVSESARGRDSGLTCPGCGDRLVARQGQVLAHHFAHDSGRPVGEGCVHAAVKWILYERLKSAVGGGDDFVVCRWACEGCQDYHELDIIERFGVVGVSLEVELPNARVQPDVTCWDSSGQPSVLVEIVVSHRPEVAVLETGFPVLEVRADGNGDRQQLEHGVVEVKHAHNTLPCPYLVESLSLGRRQVQQDVCRYKGCPDLSVVCSYCACFWLAQGVTPPWFGRA